MSASDWEMHALCAEGQNDNDPTRLSVCVHLKQQVLIGDGLFLSSRSDTAPISESMSQLAAHVLTRRQRPD